MTIKSINSSLGRPVVVRIATRADAEGIRAVINSAFRLAEGFFVDEDRIDVKAVLDYLDSGKFLLAEREGLLLGCVYVEPHHLPTSQGFATARDVTPAEQGQEDGKSLSEIQGSLQENHDVKFSRAYLGLLAVDPAHQQSGLGTQLMDAAEAHCRRLGASFMDIKVVSLRTELFGYYRRRGYVETGISPFPTAIATRLPCHFLEMSKSLHGPDDYSSES